MADPVTEMTSDVDELLLPDPEVELEPESELELELVLVDVLDETLFESEEAEEEEEVEEADEAEEEEEGEEAEEAEEAEKLEVLPDPPDPAPSEPEASDPETGTGKPGGGTPGGDPGDPTTGILPLLSSCCASEVVGAGPSRGPSSSCGDPPAMSAGGAPPEAFKCSLSACTSRFRSICNFASVFSCWVASVEPGAAGGSDFNR